MMNIRTEFIRFMVVGAFINATDFGIYYILFHYLPFSASKVISFTCAGIAGYLLNKYWTFEHNQPSSSEVRRYALVSFLALGTNVLTNQHILNLWPRAVLLALIIASVLSSLLTFIAFKWWVFKI